MKPQSWNVFQLLVSEKTTFEPSLWSAGNAQARREVQELRARPPGHGAEAEQRSSSPAQSACSQP